MLSKLLVSHCRVGWRGIGLSSGLPLLGPTPAVRRPVKAPLVRYAGVMLPPSQYDTPLSSKFHLVHTMVHNWELIPVFVTTAISILLVFLAIAWASKNKVDVMFSTHSCNNISRTMNLRRPTVHKIIIINQRYDPWPEMQDVLDKMTVAEHRALMKATKCSYESREGHLPPDVDVVFTTHSRDNISRTMDLRNPSVHKIVTINQRYEPWPEMQRVLDKIKFAEKRELSRRKKCFPR